ncbi:hypothetical protein BKK79_37045 (plasmid) [Cupriavidus sp. USMAA2-4]|nr:hypothetical protein BKK79_37045 [Cupriavidus sp. USMAA2-4]
MIVAITLLAIIALISWRALDGVTRARAALSDEMENLRALDQLFGQLRDDGAELVDDRDLRAPALAFAPGQLRLVRTVRQDGQPLRWQVVRYRLEQHTVLRYASPPAESRAALIPLLDGPPADAGLPIASGIAVFQARAWVGGRGWIADMRDARQVAPVLAVSNDPEAGTSGIRGIELTVRPDVASGAYLRLVPVRP